MRTKDFLILLTRLFLGYVFLSAGFCKITGGHFGQLIGPPWLEQKLAQYGLGLFAQVVAYSQIICGALLFSQRFSTLGAVMLVPMNISILAVTVSQQWQGTPYVNAVFLILNVLLLTYEWKKFRFLFTNRPHPIESTPLDDLRSNHYNLVGLGLILLAGGIAPFQPVTAAFIVAAAFIVFYFPIIIGTRFHLIEKVVVGQSIANMLMITLAFRLGPVQIVIGVSTLILALILTTWIFIRVRKNGKAISGVNDMD